MPVSPLTTTFIQSTFLNAISNILAQLIAQYGDKVFPSPFPLYNFSPVPLLGNNILTQTKQPFDLHLLPLIQYLTYNTLVIPPNFYWQRFLEKRYPGSLRWSHLHVPGTATASASTPGSQGPVKEIKDKPLTLPQPVTHSPSSQWLSPGTKNFVAKFLLDQSVGSVGNILLFIVLINLLQGGGAGVVWAAVLEVCSFHLLGN